MCSQAMDAAFLWLLDIFSRQCGHLFSKKKKAAEVVYVRVRACLPLTSQNSYRVERATGNETEKLPPFSDTRLTVARSEQCCEQ